MQAILGAGGDIGTLLAKALTHYTNDIRLVSRHPKKVNDTDELMQADLTKKDEVFNAVKGTTVVYLTAGFKYSTTVWQKTWPAVMQNVIDACLQFNTKLVFFDNVYMYDKAAISHMTEDSAINPPSKKGRVRAQLHNMILKAINEKGLMALIARSADFYGPDAKNGILNIAVIQNFKKGKKAFWQSDAAKIHSLTFTCDAAKATALLGNTADAYGQVWHLPTSAEKLRGKDFIALTAKAMNIKARYYIMQKWMIGLTGFFVPLVKELKEMQYQNDQNYFFDSSKFTKRFGITPTSYAEGIKQAVL